MQTIKNHKTKLIAVGVALFALVAIFVVGSVKAEKAQACDTGCYPDVSGYCDVDVSQAEIGQTVTFTGHGTGGDNVYYYNWSGTDGLTADTRSVSHSYSTSGTKSATVRITSNSQSVFKTCTVYIKPAVVNPCPTGCYPNVGGYCDVDVSQAEIGQTVTFTGHGTGGDNVYYYNWSGDDGLTADTRTVSHSYSTSGTKSATVRITSNSQSVFKTCTVNIKPRQVDNLNVYCTANPSQANIGDTITYTSNVSGGNGNYSYSWSGTDGLSSTNSSVSKSYSSSGTKTATVTVTSDGQSRTASCSAFIKEKDQTPDLGGYCEGRPSTVDEDEKVTWTAYPNGGNGSYKYDWSGDDGLDGDDKSITKRYDDSGTKEARVTITSDGHSITKSCDIKVRKEDDNDDLDAYCTASPSTANINENVKFTVYASDGKGSYHYSWDGDDDLDGSGKTVTHSYRTAGTKDATVKVKDDNDEVKATCHVNIQGDSIIYVPPTQGGVYLDTIPATGINPSMKTALFLTGTIVWSAFLGYIYVLRRKMKLEEERLIEEATNS